jgi:hypothetical protein
MQGPGMRENNGAFWRIFRAGWAAFFKMAPHDMKFTVR